MAGGLVKAILEIAPNFAQLLQAVLMEGGLVKTTLEIVVLRWRM